MRATLWLDCRRPWGDLLARARQAEQAGWDAVRVVDTVEGWECWALVGALAAAVPRLRLDAVMRDDLGRHPGVVAKLASTTDRLSEGRLLVGWVPAADPEAEPRLAEAIEVVRSLTKQPRTTFEGRFYRLDDAPLDPKPVQQPLPLLLSGTSPALAAKYADHWAISGDPDQIQAQLAALSEACQELGRNRSEIQISARTEERPPPGVDEWVIDNEAVGDDPAAWRRIRGDKPPST